MNGGFIGDSGLTNDEIARRGREIYERDIRAEVERGHDGEFLVVDATSGGYEVFARLESKNPGGVFFLMRVGRPAAHRIGGTLR